MKVNISTLRNKLGAALQKTAVVQSPVLDFQHVSDTEVPVAVSLTVTNTEHGYCVEMKVSFRLTLRCTRCLAYHSEDIAGETSEYFLRVGAESESAARTELEAFLDDAMPTFSGDELDLTAFTAESVLLAVPVRSLCREDCRGLCSQCGTDLNSESCACETNDTDPRLADLADIFKKL